jgi:uncharacterized protein (TIGR02271 family)
MSTSQTITVIDKHGLRGKGAWIAPPSGSSEEWRVLVQFDNGERVIVTNDLLTQEQDGVYHLVVSLDELEHRLPPGEELVIPIIEEQLEVGKSKITTGVVEINKRIEERVEKIEQDLAQEEVEIERVPINRPVEGEVSTRYEGHTLVIPLLEEVLVVEKRLMLREEVHIRKLRTEGSGSQQVTLRREHVEIQRRSGTETASGSARNSDSKDRR